MKKILFLCLCGLLFSCSENDELQEIISSEDAALLNEFRDVANGYELMIKGYTLDEVEQEKDETPQKKEKATYAEPWMIKAIQDYSSKTAMTPISKTRTDAQAYGGSADRVGIFKYGSCGNYREFVYFMGCEDGGVTRSYGNVGSTTVDGNVTFRFCLVEPGNYGGGTLLLYNYQWTPSEGSVDIVRRYHDNEDRRNSNEIKDDGGLTSTGPCSFSHNTAFVWRFSERPARKMPFTYGVLSNSTPPATAPLMPIKIIIDDENSKNGNEAIIWSHVRLNPIVGSTSTRMMANGESFRGVTAQSDGDTSYTLVTY